MNLIKTLVFVIMPFCIFQKSIAQTVNWETLENSNHIISVGIGWDYSFSYNLGYAYQLKVKTPLLLTANFSIPSGETLLDDFKTKIGAQVLLLDKDNLKGTVVLNGIYRRYENPLVRLHNFGSEFKVTFGYYKSRWFAAGEVGFDKAIVTHFKHSEIFKETIFPDVEDGWYEPATGGNFNYGLLTGYSFKKSDLTFNLGMSITQDFRTTPSIPLYLMLGYNYRLD
ncbi:MAG: hypothetical protein AAF348_05235 [Bacteroidota bacterium]